MVFKKQISILLTFFLLVSNLGLAFNVHYCADEIASISINTAPAEAVDSCCGVVEKESSCCNDKVIKAEIKSDQIIVKTLTFDAPFILVTDYWKPQVFIVNENFKQQDKVTYYCDANAPPFYLLYSQFTFYC
ncbi:MAG: hypothetical protein QM710_06215 [Flavobacterium sp.]